MTPEEMLDLKHPDRDMTLRLYFDALNGDIIGLKALKLDSPQRKMQHVASVFGITEAEALAAYHADGWITT